jgi:glycosyltransferase 2 family protein
MLSVCRLQKFINHYWKFCDLIEKLKKNLIITVILSSLIFFAFSAFADFKSVFNSFSKFNWFLFPILLLLSFGNYIVRFFKWQYYLKCLKIKVATGLSLKIFLSGLAMSASPAKMGEVLKSFLLKEINNEPISKTAPIIFAERMTDFLSLTFLTIVVGLYFNYTGLIAYFILLFFIVLIVLISNRRLAEFVIRLVSRIPFINRHLEKIIILYESAYILLKPRPLILMFFVSVFSWLFECFGFYLILINFGLNVNVLWPVFVYALSTIVGAVSMLPGGLGVTEGSLSLILINYGMAKELAVASTIIIRIATLWFAVLLGVVFLFLLKKDMNKLKVKTEL